ncbi:MAG: tRNA pseudouridine(55) synthase TruB [Candidatus Kapaibacteriota bacterium]|jgi:tRNA pseudouridine55 synthase
MIIIDKYYTGNLRELFAEATSNEIFLLVNKPKDWTSFDVVAKIRNTIRVKKIGHAGTLDPLASGLLIMAIGKATKKIDSMQAIDKNYIATIKLGATTKTFDLESDEENPIDASKVNKSDIENVLKDLRGVIRQTPPLYSAKKIKGQRMYVYARKNEEVEIPEIEITVNNIEILEYENTMLKLDINCSKGTYIRTIANDIGKKLGVGGYLSDLVRDSIGEYKLENALELDDFLRIFRETPLLEVL